MKKRLSLTNMTVVVLTVLLAVSVGELAFLNAKSGEEKDPTVSLTKDQDFATYSWFSEDSSQGHIFLKRAKKNTRVGKTFLGYTNAHYQNSTLLASDKTDSYQSIFTLNSGLLLLYCVLQI